VPRGATAGSRLRGHLPAVPSPGPPPRHPGVSPTRHPAVRRIIRPGGSSYACGDRIASGREHPPTAVRPGGRPP
jgi:hypothetical protein